MQGRSYSGRVHFILRSNEWSHAIPQRFRSNFSYRLVLARIGFTQAKSKIFASTLEVYKFMYQPQVNY